MKLPLNPALDRLPVYQPGRPIEEVARELGLDPNHIIKLASNENPLGPSPAAVAAIQAAATHAHLYPDGSAFRLKRRLAQALDVRPENLVLGNGSNEILELAGLIAIAPGSEVVVSAHSFAVYPIVTRLFGGELITVPARELGHDLPAMTKALNARTRVVFVANPNNPTGTLAPADEVLALVRQAPATTLVVMDEAYIEFVEKPADLLPLIRSGAQENLLLCRTFSKIHGLAGLRIGYGIGHVDLIAALEKARQPFNVNALAQAAALAALDDTEHIRRTRDTNRAGLRQLEEGFRALGLRWIPSAANFVLVQVGDGQRAFLDLQRQGVITRPMAVYGLPEWLRITVGTEEENRRCLAALERK